MNYNVPYTMNGSNPTYWSMPNWIKYLAFLLVFTISCNSEPTTQGEEQTAPTTEEAPGLPEGFEDFYKKFHTDSSFQMDHIQFPLQGVPEDRSMASDTFTFKKDSWKLHQAFNTSNGTFEQRFQNIGKSIVVEYIFSPRLQLIMERRFQKREDGWHLIYYKELGDRSTDKPDQ